MAENNENSVSVRVPEWVMDEIEEAIKAKPRPRPSRGELLTEAWRVYASVQTKGPVLNAEKLPREIPRQMPYAAVQSGSQKNQRVVQVSAEEWQRIDQLVRILRSGAQAAIRPLLANIDSFEILAELIAKEPQEPHGEDRPVPRKSLGSPEEALAELRAAEAASRNQLRATEEAAKSLEQAKKDLRSGEAGDTRPDSRRGRNAG